MSRRLARLPALAAAALSLAFPTGAAHAYGDLNLVVDAISATEIRIVWEWYEFGPGDPSGHPEWVGYDLFRRDPAACSPWVRLNAEIIPRVPGVTHGGTIVDVPPASGVTWEYWLDPVDAARQHVLLIGGYCDPPCAPHAWESIPKLAAPVTIARVEGDLGWSVWVSPCTDACWAGFVVSEPDASLLRPHVGTGQYFRFYGDELFGTFEGSYLYLDHFEPAGCGPTPAAQPTWGSVRVRYR